MLGHVCVCVCVCVCDMAAIICVSCFIWKCVQYFCMDFCIIERREAVVLWICETTITKEMDR